MANWRMVCRMLLIFTGASFLAMEAAALGYAQAVSLGFPVSGQNPYTAPIITVLDHSTDYFYDLRQTEVLAYTGEMGKDRCSPSGVPLVPGHPCGYYNPSFSQRDDNVPPLGPLEFIVNGSYTGTSEDCVTPRCSDETKVLNYRGHSGYDYGYGQNTVIVAAADGVLYIPANDPVNDPSGSDPWCDFHTFYIDHGNGWTTWYLHAHQLNTQLTAVLPTGVPHLCTNGKASHISKDERIAQIHKGDPIALVGNFADGVEGTTGVIGYHLHFEVRRGCDFANGAVQSCMVVDPYGWESWTSDTIQNTMCANDRLKHCATAQTTPLWNLSDWNIRVPLVTNVSLSQSSNGFTAIITGQNFDLGALVTLWSRQGQYHITNVIPSSLTSNQIIAQLPNPPVSDPGFVVLKIHNPLGPRSVPTTLSIPPAASSVPLVLNGQSAPGGGTFAGFVGFESANDRGEVSFSAGVDLNGDGAPDTFADFELSAGQMIKLAVPGFTNISSVVTHVKINNSGDKAFGDVNGTFGASPAAIYLLTSGSSTPTRIVTQGGPCPSPCPVSGSPTVDQLTGPLAIGETGDVTFAASLTNQQTHSDTCCYLFLYSASDGSITRVATDGPNGDPSPVGGTFTNGALLGGINLITSDGDVVFTSQVTGGSSQAGIFRFSRGHGLSKVVAQGDPVPGPVHGIFGFPLMGRVGSVSGRQLVFHAPVSGGSSDQIIGVIKDVTQNNPTSIIIVAFQGQPTGTSVGGSFSEPSHRPFGGFGLNTAPPVIRSDGAVVFHSFLVGAQSSPGNPTDRGLFLWNGITFHKIVVDGDEVSAGSHIHGVFAPAINNRGEVSYFAATIQ